MANHSRRAHSGTQGGGEREEDDGGARGAQGGGPEALQEDPRREGHDDAGAAVHRDADTEHAAHLGLLRHLGEEAGAGGHEERAGESPQG